MDSVDDLLNDARPQEPRRARPSHPKGWEPGVTVEGNRGTVTALTEGQRDPSWDGVLRHFGFNPDEFEILEPVNVRTWDANLGNGEVKQFWYHKANIVRRQAGISKADYEELAKEIRRHKPPKTQSTGDNAFVICPADWQIGKGENGGTPGISKRILRMIDDFESRTRTLRKQGVSLSACYIGGMGDFVEQVDGHYPMQAYGADLSLREQKRLAWRLLMRLVRRASLLYERVVFVALPGNHGEYRKNGKAFTDFGDNIDLEIADTLSDLCKENPDAYGHVSFMVPDKELTVTLEIAGAVVAFGHGHQAKRGGGNAQAKVRKWWEGQAFGMRAPGDAAILVTADKHHFSAVQEGPRTHFQCPTLEGASQWFTEGSGLEAAPGTLSFVVGPDGWDHLAIL